MTSVTTIITAMAMPTAAPTPTFETNVNPAETSDVCEFVKNTTCPLSVTGRGFANAFCHVACCLGMTETPTKIEPHRVDARKSAVNNSVSDKSASSLSTRYSLTASRKACFCSSDLWTVGVDCTYPWHSSKVIASDCTNRQSTSLFAQSFIGNDVVGGITPVEDVQSVQGASLKAELVDGSLAVIAPAAEMLVFGEIAIACVETVDSLNWFAVDNNTGVVVEATVSIDGAVTVADCSATCVCARMRPVRLEPVISVACVAVSNVPSA